MRNWDKWQTYRTDRGNPPWIKVYRALMRNIDWITLTDEQRGQLVAMWLLAADKDGRVPADPSTLKTVCSMTNEPDLNLFKDKGFVVFGAKMAPDRRQDDATLTPQSRVDQSRVDHGMADETPLFAEIVAHLNEKAGTAYRHATPATRRHISARLKEGFSAEDFRAVIDAKVSDWRHDPTMSKFLRPETLFGTKFESYLQAAKAAPPKPKEPPMLMYDDWKAAEDAEFARKMEAENAGR